MIAFYVLLTLLILSIIFFIMFPIIKDRTIGSKFKSKVSKQVHKICNAKKIDFIDNLKIRNFRLNYVSADHVIFGKKNIYLIYQYPLVGEVSGNETDNSWIYYDINKKEQQIVTNLNRLANENSRDLQEILNLNANIFKTISVIPNECNFLVKSDVENENIVTNYSKLLKAINTFENQNNEDLNKTFIKNAYNLLRNKNEEERQTNKH